MRNNKFVPSELALHNLDRYITFIHTKFTFCGTNYCIQSSFLNHLIGKPDLFVFFTEKIDHTNMYFSTHFDSSMPFLLDILLFYNFLLYYIRRRTNKVCWMYARQILTRYQQDTIYKNKLAEYHHITLCIKTISTFQFALMLVSKIYLTLKPSSPDQSHCISANVLTRWYGNKNVN